MSFLSNSIQTVIREPDTAIMLADEPKFRHWNEESSPEHSSYFIISKRP
jgi:hypothetical protein